MFAAFEFKHYKDVEENKIYLNHPHVDVRKKTYDIFVTHSLIQVQKMYVHNSVIKQYIVYLNYTQMVAIPLH